MIGGSMEIQLSMASHLVKPLKYYVNRNYRKRIKPRRGSVVYSDFGMSGIYAGNNRIIGINVENLANQTSEVKSVTVEEFLRNCRFPESVYVSADDRGALENLKVCEKAEKYVGLRNDFGLIFKDSHSFTKKCLDYSEENFFDAGENLEERIYSETGLLKQKAKNKIGATKWLLWELDESESDEQGSSGEDFLETESANEAEEGETGISKEERDSFRSLNIGETIRKYEEIPLNDEIILHLQKELNEMWDFFREISEEKMPDHIMKIIIKIMKTLEEIIFSYEQNENSLKGLGGDFSYRQLREMGDEFKHLVAEMTRNRHIRDVLKRLGKGRLEKSDKNISKVAKINKDEVFGITKSSSLARILPSELLNLEDGGMKYLFYSKYLENRLLTYEIKGRNEIEKDEAEEKMNSKGPVVVCLDTSGSMKGTPLQRAKALVLAIIKMLKDENRELYIVLFGAKGQYQELAVEDESQITEAVKFLKKGYDGGTDFETPLKRAMEIISEKERYEKADILMVTDGACKISYTFKRVLKNEKERLKFKIYTVICEADRTEKDFSDAVLVI